MIPGLREKADSYKIFPSKNLAVEKCRSGIWLWLAEVATGYLEKCFDVVNQESMISGVMDIKTADAYKQTCLTELCAFSLFLFFGIIKVQLQEQHFGY